MAPEERKINQGLTALRRDWVVGGRRFSIIAMYSSSGFLAYRIMNGNIDHDRIERFITEDVSGFCGGKTCLIFDNASVHLVPSTLALIDRVTDGRWKRPPHIVLDYLQLSVVLEMFGVMSDNKNTSTRAEMLKSW